LVAATFAGRFFSALTAFRLFFSASIRFVTWHLCDRQGDNFLSGDIPVNDRLKPVPIRLTSAAQFCAAAIDVLI
jgi:hypothetical protein